MSKGFLDKLNNAKTDEAFKQITEDNRFILTDADLEQVYGGRTPQVAPTKN